MLIFFTLYWLLIELPYISVKNYSSSFFSYLFPIQLMRQKPLTIHIYTLFYFKYSYLTSHLIELDIL
jgi:hypothetical protein